MEKQGILFILFLVAGVVAGLAWLATAVQLRHVYWGPENLVRRRATLRLLRFAAIATGMAMLLNVARHLNGLF